MSVGTLNHADLAVSRLTGMYQDKPKWVALTRLLAACLDDWESVLTWLSRLDDLDAVDVHGNPLVVGVLLDTLGARSGQSRRITRAIPVLLFGWDDDASALAWGEESDPLAGGSWWEEGQSLSTDAVLDDASYRIAIRMRRTKNSAKVVNLETLITSLLFLFPDATTLGTYGLVLTELTGTVLIGLGRAPTQLEVALFRYAGAFPKPAGIELGAYWWTSGSPVFGFDDDPDPDVVGWFEEGSPTSGGVLRRSSNHECFSTKRAFGGLGGVWRYYGTVYG